MNIQTLAERFRAARAALVDARDAKFPRGMRVVVAAPQYHGPGVVVRAGCSPDQVAVRIPNENTWWYPVECVSPELPQRVAVDPPRCCEAELRKAGKAYSGHNQEGERWVCPACQSEYEYSEDEAEGGGWHVVKAVTKGAARRA